MNRLSVRSHSESRSLHPEISSYRRRFHKCSLSASLGGSAVPAAPRLMRILGVDAPGVSVIGVCSVMTLPGIGSCVLEVVVSAALMSAIRRSWSCDVKLSLKTFIRVGDSFSACSLTRMLLAELIARQAFCRTLSASPSPSRHSEPPFVALSTAQTAQPPH